VKSVMTPNASGNVMIFIFPAEQEHVSKRT
jgi:hypothetical protein